MEHESKKTAWEGTYIRKSMVMVTEDTTDTGGGMRYITLDTISGADFAGAIQIVNDSIFARSLSCKFILKSHTWEYSGPNTEPRHTQFTNSERRTIDYSCAFSILNESEVQIPVIGIAIFAAPGISYDENFNKLRYEFKDGLLKLHLEHIVERTLYDQFTRIVRKKYNVVAVYERQS